MKWIDPIVEEVRKAREEIWKESNYDLDQLCIKLRERQKAHASRVVTKSELSTKKHIRLSNLSKVPTE